MHDTDSQETRKPELPCRGVGTYRYSALILRLVTPPHHRKRRLWSWPQSRVRWGQGKYKLKILAPTDDDDGLEDWCPNIYARNARRNRRSRVLESAPDERAGMVGRSRLVTFRRGLGCLHRLLTRWGHALGHLPVLIGAGLWLPYTAHEYRRPYRHDKRMRVLGTAE